MRGIILVFVYTTSYLNLNGMESMQCDGAIMIPNLSPHLPIIIKERCLYKDDTWPETITDEDRKGRARKLVKKMLESNFYKSEQFEKHSKYMIDHVDNLVAHAIQQRKSLDSILGYNSKSCYVDFIIKKNDSKKRCYTLATVALGFASHIQLFECRNDIIKTSRQIPFNNKCHVRKIGWLSNNWLLVMHSPDLDTYYNKITLLKINKLEKIEEVSIKLPTTWFCLNVLLDPISSGICYITVSDKDCVKNDYKVNLCTKKYSKIALPLMIADDQGQYKVLSQNNINEIVEIPKTPFIPLPIKALLKLLQSKQQRAEQKKSPSWREWLSSLFIQHKEKQNSDKESFRKTFLVDALREL